MQREGTDVRSDLYSLAVTLHQLLTGHEPPGAVARAHKLFNEDHDPLRPAHEPNPQVSAAISEVLHRAASLKKHERPTTAAEMREALRRAGEPEPVRSTVNLPDQPAEPTTIDPPLPPTARVESVSDVQQVEAPIIALQQLPAEERETGRVQIDLSGKLTKQPEIKQPRGNGWKWVAVGCLLLLVIGIVITSTRNSSVPLESFIQDLGNGVKLEMVAVRGGTFEMGSDNYTDTEPKHQVTISPFAIGKYEVTQAQWKVVVGRDVHSGDFKGDNLPVALASWEYADEFCRMLSDKTGRKYRLPTEAEWEYAASAGSKGEYSFGDDKNRLGEYSWFRDNSGAATHPVGQKKPNDWGLYDMHGNASEWVQDWYDKDYYQQSVGSPDPRGPLSGDRRVLRGGSWNDDSTWGPISARSHAPPYAYNWVGFRVATAVRNQ